jgi:hypothetical protein
MKTLLPYDKKRIPVEIDDQNFAGLLVSRVESKPRWTNQLVLPHLSSLQEARKTLSLSVRITPALFRRKSLRPSCCGVFVQRSPMPT